MEENIKNIIGDVDYRILKSNGRDLYATKDGRLINDRGKELGSYTTYGYRVLNFNGRTRQASHLIWEAFNGEIPDGMEIDHINTVRDDNRLENLRVVTHKENCNNELSLKHRREQQYLKERVGEKNPMYGKCHTQESKEKMRLAAIERQAKVKGVLYENNAIAFIVKKGLYDEYTKWVYEIVMKKFNQE